MKEFFGLAGYSDGEYHYLRDAQGAWGWEHLLFVSLLIAAMVALAIFVGRYYKDKSLERKNKPLIISAIAIDSFEIVKIVVLCIRCQDAMHWIYVLPLFLCSVQLIALPMCAFCHGRVREASLDFVMIFGILGAVFGTIGAAQNYNAFPVLSMDNVFSGITHTISGFASLYIIISGLTSMKKKNMPITLGILLGVSVIAYIVNHIIDYNYMFLMNHDGTPYSIFYNMVDGNVVLYPLIVVGLFVIYAVGEYFIVDKIRSRKAPVEK